MLRDIARQSSLSLFNRVTPPGQKTNSVNGHHPIFHDLACHTFSVVLDQIVM